MTNKIKIGQRYKYTGACCSVFIGEVIEVLSEKIFKLRVVQDISYGCGVGKIWFNETVSNYEYLPGQDAPV
jgi:hypothetical protein